MLHGYKTSKGPRWPRYGIGEANEKKSVLRECESIRIQRATEHLDEMTWTFCFIAGNRGKSETVSEW